MRNIDYNPIEGLFILNPTDKIQKRYSNIRDSIKWDYEGQRSGAKYGFKNLTLALTTDCNLNCTYCWQKHDNHDNDMNKETIDRWLDFFLDSENNAPSKVLYYGGEPTLRLDLIQYASTRIKSICAEKGITGVNQHMFTNGILLTEENLDLLEQAGVFIVLSLDGNPELTAQTRRLSPEVYKNRILNAVESMHNRGMKFGVACTIGDIHFSVKDTAEYIAKYLRPSSVEFNLRHDIEMVEKFNNENDFSYNSLFEAWDVSLNNGIKVIDLAKRVKSYVTHEPLVNCSSGSKNKLSIMNNGMISTYNGAISFPEMQIDPKCDNWLDAVRSNWRRNILKTHEKCANCEVAYICGQGSAFSSFLQYNDFNAIPAYHCYLCFAELEYIKRRIAQKLEVNEPNHIVTSEELKRIFLL